MNRTKNFKPILYRQYTLCNELDFRNVQQGLCPDYALWWDDELNKKYWPEGHNFIGNRKKKHYFFKIEYILSLHHLTFETPTLGGVLSDKGDAFSALEIRKGVKILEMRDQPQPWSKSLSQYKHKRVDFEIFRDVLPFEPDDCIDDLYC